MSDAPTPKQVLFGLMDSVMLLAPGGWTALELKVADTKAGVRLSAIESRGEGAEDPKPRPELEIEAPLEALRLSDTLEGLRQVLAGQGKPWTPGSVRVERGSDFVDWKLLRDDGTPAWFDRLDRSALDLLLVTEPLYDALRGTERAFASLQARLDAALGELRGFQYQAAARRLTVERADGSSATFPVQHLGTFDVDQGAWLWGWADAAVPAEATADVRRVCSPDVPAPGLSALWRPGYYCDLGFSWAVAGHVVVSLGARGLFKAASEDGKAVTLLAIG